MPVTSNFKICTLIQNSHTITSPSPPGPGETMNFIHPFRAGGNLQQVPGGGGEVPLLHGEASAQDSVRAQVERAAGQGRS